MKEFLKAAAVEKAAELSDGELALINRQTLKELTADEVFAFRLAACGNQVDRDYERFTDGCLDKLAPMFVGRTVLMDHNWSAGSQTARVYAAEVEPGEGDYKRLVLRCYMPRTPGTAEIVSALESGVLRECSVGLRVGKIVCSICGMDQKEGMCPHYHGRVYDGQICHFDLDDPQDVYEVSLVAVPAQPDAGVIKSKRYCTKEEGGEPVVPAADEAEIKSAMLHMELEEKRYGGNET